MICLGLNHRHHTEGWTQTNCNKCGKTVGKDNGTGRLYAVSYGRGESGFEYTAAVCWKAHTHTDVEVEAWTIYMASVATAAHAEGKVIKGDTVEVYKGRKVPVGTTGIIRWMGKDGYDNERVGLSIPGEDKLIYTALSNIRLTTI